MSSERLGPPGLSAAARNQVSKMRRVPSTSALDELVTLTIPLTRSLVKSSVTTRREWRLDAIAAAPPRRFRRLDCDDGGDRRPSTFELLSGGERSGEHARLPVIELPRVLRLGYDRLSSSGFPPSGSAFGSVPAAAGSIAMRPVSTTRTG